MLPVLITMRDMPVSKSLETELRRKAEKLSLYCQRILSCRILITLPQKRKRQGKLYSVHIDLSVPGKLLAGSNRPDEDIRVAIRDAFLALRHQIDHYAKKRHHRAAIQHHRAHLSGNGSAE